jgi:hypothetical protein
LLFFEFLNVLFIYFFDNLIFIKQTSFNHKNEMKSEINLLSKYFLVDFDQATEWFSESGRAGGPHRRAEDFEPPQDLCHYIPLSYFYSLCSLQKQHEFIHCFYFHTVQEQETCGTEDINICCLKLH